MSYGSSIEIEVPATWIPAVAAVLKEHGREEIAKSLLRAVKDYGSRSHDLNIEDWDVILVKAVLGVFQGAKGLNQAPRALISTLKSYGRVLTNPLNAKVSKLELLPKAMQAYLAADAIDGWLYRVTENRYIAYAIEDIRFHPRDRESPGYVRMKLKANRPSWDEDRERSGNELYEERVTFSHDDIVKGPVARILLDEGYFKETPELKAEYLANMALFTQYQPMFNKQFLCSDSALTIDKYWWRTDSRYKLPHPTKMVNDEELLERKIKEECNDWFWQGVEGAEGKFRTIPVHPYLLFFDLARHCQCWMHVSNIKPYVYHPELRDKLVLPENHRDLIDVLTADMDVFVDDIVEGKSGGTAILCYGEPGLGKTLTAEVYAELVERPLYRIHAGQLGTEIDTVETQLTAALRRAERWGAVMLIDEADVYIRRRDNDVSHNAVVAAFLKTLEYFSGLLFMTTNRVSDVDDAIVSRMVAMFKYETPTAQQAKAIWKILSTQFGIKLSDKFISELYQEFESCSGRDIKQLLKLTMKFCKQKELRMDMEAFRVCAMFRGIK